MIAYLSRRLLGLVPLLLGITLISFMVIHVAPGSPMDLLTDMNPDASPELRDRLAEHWGLDEPLPVQYAMWLKRVVVGDFGNSLSRDPRPVIDKVAEALPVTLVLNLMSLCLVMAAAIPIGVYSATHPYSRSDRAATVFVFLVFAMPTFWLALLCMMLFVVELAWLPVLGLQSLVYNSPGPCG